MSIERVPNRFGQFQLSAKVDGRRITPTEWFPVVIPLIEAAVVVLVAVATGLAYHWTAYGHTERIGEFVMLGLVAAFWLTLMCSFRSDYELEKYLTGGRGISGLLNVWTTVFIALLLIGFLTKTSDMVSRGWLMLFYGAGFAAVTGFDYLVRQSVLAAARSGNLQARRLLLVGTNDANARFMSNANSRQTGIAIAAFNALPPSAALEAMPDAELQSLLRQCVENARGQRITDVVLLLDPGSEDQLSRVSEGLMDLPATIHLGGFGLLEQFPALRAERVGLLRTFSLVRAPMSFVEKLMKRTLDILLAGLALFALSPLFLVVCLLIKRDSPGPAFFRQRRRGYNQVEFRIFKFRTMTTMDDGNTVIQATRDDERVTSLGRFLRKSNIDELPQLINVLRGEMSLVGPRPHAVAHDVHYGSMIERYARRLNVKPGITGWAQVNGFRGPTATDEAMRDRVSHDLYYIDNWSIALDLKIMAMTVFSRKAFSNAF